MSKSIVGVYVLNLTVPLAAAGAFVVGHAEWRVLNPLHAAKLSCNTFRRDQYYFFTNKHIICNKKQYFARAILPIFSFYAVVREGAFIISISILLQISTLNCCNSCPRSFALLLALNS
mmetsp:Transcript_48267/g.94316  ORF Transcript_48267/g.94316 Transcript_48267/m.94316 type:complete len:118 (-) Transcript_48267:1948-2301(-)